jgi:hypothetical protein
MISKSTNGIMLLKRNTTLSGTFERIIALLFALRAITYVWLAFASDIYMPFYATFVSALRYITIPAGLCYVIIKQRRANVRDMAVLLPLFIYWFLLLFNTYGGYQGSYLHELISIGCFLWMNRDMKTKIFHYFYKTVVIIGSISIIIYIAYLMKLPIGFEQLPFYNDGVQTSYYRRWAIFAIIDSGYSLPRLCGIFNEPGALGTVCGLLFAATFHYSKKWEKIILIITTVFSFSLAGYLLIVVYLIIYFAQKNWKYAFIVIGLAFFLVIIPNIDWHNNEINNFAQRFSITSQGLMGDNRTTTAFDSEFENIISSSDIWFGKGATYTSGYGTSSYKNFIVQFGIIGFGLFFIIWLMTAIKSASHNKDCLILIIIFLISLYQRPVTLINTYGYVLIFGGFTWIINEKQKQENAYVNNTCYPLQMHKQSVWKEGNDEERFNIKTF